MSERADRIADNEREEYWREVRQREAKSREGTIDPRERIQGVGVLRFPQRATKDQLEDAHQLARNIRQGCIICLPNGKDCEGNYEWDFRIEGGDPGQVIVKRQGE